jgi:rubredoxin
MKNISNLFYMKFACSSCLYSYDESIGEPALMIEAGTSFEELGEEFYCPNCQGDKEDFVELAQEINYPLDYDDLTPLESEHFPIFIDE